MAGLFHDWDVEEFGDLGQKSCSMLEEEFSGLFWCGLGRQECQEKYK